MYPLLALGFAIVAVLCTLGMRLLLISRCREGLRLYLRDMQVQGIFIACLNCGFDLRGSSTGICPECGNEPPIVNKSCATDTETHGRNPSHAAEFETPFQACISYCREHINSAKHPRAMRFGIGSVITIVIIMLVISGIHNSNLSNLNVHGFGHFNQTYSWHVKWGEDNGSLEFVVFEGYPITNPNDLTGLVTFTSDVNEGSHAWVSKPDGTRLRFPSTLMLIEYIDGQYRESTEQVSLEVFESYLATKPTKYTIDGLLSYAKKKP